MLPCLVAYFFTYLESPNSHIWGRKNQNSPDIAGQGWVVFRLRYPALSQPNTIYRLESSLCNST